GEHLGVERERARRVRLSRRHVRSESGTAAHGVCKASSRRVGHQGRNHPPRSGASVVEAGGTAGRANPESAGVGEKTGGDERRRKSSSARPVARSAPAGTHPGGLRALWRGG